MNDSLRNELIDKGPEFIVINTKHLVDIPQGQVRIIKDVIEQLPHNQYYVCNKDEPYAEDVLDAILSGEEKKQTNCPCDKTLGKFCSKCI